jgi:hypothetical protein
MKLVILLFFSISTYAYACDGCNVFVNFSPNDYKNRISLFTRSRMMIGEYNMFGQMTLLKHASHGNDPSFWNNQVVEQYNTLELRGSFYVKEVWKTTIIVPFINNHQIIGDESRYIVSGFSDPTIMESFQVYNSFKNQNDKTFVHRLEVGVGVKAPLGIINKSYEAGLPNLDLQPGTGSFDFLGSLTYITKYKQLGFYTNLNYKFNTFNVDEYKYGNTTNLTFNAFYQTNGEKISFMPSVGVYLEQMSLDQNRYSQENIKTITKYMDTGGEILFANAGLKVFKGDFVLTTEFQKVIGSQLNGFTQLKTRYRINVGLTYSF